jgi:AcrR family transcriptional regulator
VADRDREAPAPGREQAGRERQQAEPGRGRGGQERRGPGRRAPDRGWSAGAADLVSDDLWSPYGPDWAAGRDPTAGRRPGRELAPRPRGRGQQARGRAAPSLSRAEIVDAAIAVADAEGPDAISMRRIAQVLQSGTMSLYWHVTSKEHLLDLMLDVLITEVEVPEPSGDWRADLRALANHNRAMLLRHRWVMDFIGGRPPLGPNTLLYLDRSLALLDGFGLDIPTAMNVLMTVLTYVMGAALREMREMRVQRDQEQARVDLAEWEPARAAWRDRLAADGRFTRVVRFLDAGFDPDAEETRDERFEFGLDCVIDGIAAKVPALSGATAHNGLS